MSLIGDLVEVLGLVSGEVLLAQGWGDNRDGDEIANELLVAFGMPDMTMLRDRLREAAVERALDRADVQPLPKSRIFKLLKSGEPAASGNFFRL